MSSNQELAERISALPVFNLSRGPKVDMMNLPVEDRDLIVFALRDVEGLSARANELQRDIGDTLGWLIRYMNKQEERAAVAAWLEATHPKEAAAIADVSALEIGWRPLKPLPTRSSLINLVGLDRTGNWCAPVATRGDRVSIRSGTERWLDWDHSYPPTHWCAIVDLPAVDPKDRAVARQPEAATRAGEAPSWLQDDLQFIASKSRG